MSYISKPLGNSAAMEFSIGGVNTIALLEKAKLSGVSYDGVKTRDISALTLTSGATFQEIVFANESASLEQEMVKDTNNLYITQKLKFSVMTEDTKGAEDVILGKSHVALVRKNNGKWVLVGLTNGISTTTYTNNSTNDDSARTYELTGKNLGDASNLTLTDAAAYALITRG